MLIKCPECGKDVSDKAKSCPMCGYPIKEEPKNITKESRAHQKKRRRLPNGFGQITEIKRQNLRKKYRAMVTVGRNELGKPIQKLLKPECYFTTYNEAYEALVEYHKNPYDLDDGISVSELYEKWMRKEEKISGVELIRGYESVWQYCSSVYNMRVKDLRVRHIKGVLENGIRIEKFGPNKGKEVHPTPLVQRRIKGLFTKLLDYAVENELTDHNYARDFSFSNKLIEKHDDTEDEAHIAFTEEELNILWSHVDEDPIVGWILVQSYMGWRPKEMMGLKQADLNTTNWTITGGMKTRAGKRRIVPIHSRIQPIIEKINQNAIIANNGYLFSLAKNGKYSTKSLSYDQYKYRFMTVINKLKLNPDHRPHDCRKTFVTRLKKAGADDMAIKKLVGHQISDITESAYTERDIEWLRIDIERLK